jgi:hypothetical protein
VHTTLTPLAVGSVGGFGRRWLVEETEEGDEDAVRTGGGAVRTSGETAVTASPVASFL